MVWFKVDDRLHSHPKALATSLAALGLWTLAGSWSGDHLTDGFVSDQAVSLLSRGSNELADELVAAGLWRRVRAGYRFHQWEANGDGTPRNPTKKEVVDNRTKKAEAGRLGGLASGKTRSKTEAPASARASPMLRPPTRPVPSASSKHQGDVRGRASPPPGSGPTPPAAEPPRTCPEHLDDPDPPPCGRCADARRAHDRWTADRAKRLAAAPECPRHRGKPAYNCPLCRSETLAPEEPA